MGPLGGRGWHTFLGRLGSSVFNPDYCNTLPRHHTIQLLIKVVGSVIVGFSIAPRWIDEGSLIRKRVHPSKNCLQLSDLEILRESRGLL